MPDKRSVARPVPRTPRSAFTRPILPPPVFHSRARTGMLRRTVIRPMGVENRWKAVVEIPVKPPMVIPAGVMNIFIARP